MTHSRIEPMKEAAKTIKAHWAGLVRYNISKVSNGIFEGLNSSVQQGRQKPEGIGHLKI